MDLRSRLSGRLHRLLGTRAKGNVEMLSAERATGWVAGSPDHQTSVLLTLYIDGHHALNIPADRPRADVLEAGMAPLHCGFDASLPRSLRDGLSHLVELRIGVDGPMMPGGRLRIKATAARDPADPAALQTEAAAIQQPQQGIAWFDPRRSAIVGWAVGCGSVSVHLGDEGPVTLLLDREVAGLGGGAHQGFLLPIPPELMDGVWHEAQVRFTAEGERLDGSPVRFRLRPSHPLVEVAALIGQNLSLQVRDATGNLLAGDAAARSVAVTADGQTLTLRAEAGMLCATLPDGVRELMLFDAGVTPAVALSRHLVTQTLLIEQADFVPPLDATLPGDTLPGDTLSDGQCQTATRAFAAFCATPDARFDAVWYRHTHPQGAGAAFQHYAKTGAKAGLSPGPFFDEAAARRLHPRIADAIAANRLPCAFALELVQGPGSLGSLTGFAPDLARRLAAWPLQPKGDLPRLPASPIPQPPALSRPPLPPTTPGLSPATSIYAAWVARTVLDAETRSALDQDELAFREKIIAAPLADAPLISIIMPSYNRAYTIGEAVQSVLDQSYQNWELLVCDDASEDKSAEVMRGFTDPRIRAMRFTKSNGAATRNKGLRFARGQYIAYLDSDNLWHPLFLDLMLRQLLAAPGASIAYCAYLDTEIIGARVTLDKIGRAPFRAIQLSSRNFMDLNTILHHRRIYDWMGGFDESLPRLQDWDLMLRYTSIFPPLYVDHAAVYYRRNVAWGQVTHLFHDSGAQNTVNDKTQRRLTQGHARLQIAWPGRGRITVLTAGAAPGDRLLADSLARLAAGFADVDVLDLGGAAPVPADDPAGLQRYSVPASMQRDPWRLGHVMAPLLQDRVILSVGLTPGFLRAIPGLHPGRVALPEVGPQGLHLQSLADAALRFPLGTLPLPAADPGTSQGSEPCIFLIPAPGTAPDHLAALARSYKLTLLLPPSATSPDWLLLRDGKAQAVGPDLFASCSLGASLQPVASLPPFDFALLMALQARAVPLAVLRDLAPDALSGQWIEARAAYEIKVADPKWLFEKLVKLQGDTQNLAGLAERSLRVHQIALHPELARERLAYLLYRLLFDPPQKGPVL